MYVPILTDMTKTQNGMKYKTKHKHHFVCKDLLREQYSIITDT